MDDIIIVGGGVGGLTLGLDAARGRHSLPYLRIGYPKSRPIGVGINLLPHATKELATLGLEKRAGGKVAIDHHGMRLSSIASDS